MKKIIAAFLFTASILSANAQLLYKISGKDLKEPSYILGSQHFARISFVDSIPGLRRVMDETQQVYGELIEETKLPEGELNKYILLPEGVTFESLFTTEELQRLHTYATESCHIDSSQWEMLHDLKPEAVSLYLGFKKDRVQNTGYDDYFKKQALAQGKSVGGFETYEFQTKMFFDATLERQKERLMCAIDNDFKNPDEENEHYYYTQDFKYIWKRFQQGMEEACYSREEYCRMLDDRNADWLTKMPDIMQQKSTLFVVGFGHLPGNQGVLNLLRKAGYKVKPVKK